MTEQARKRSARGHVASRFDKITLAAFAVLLFIVIVAVSVLGTTTAGDRLGCGLNDIVNVVMA